MRRASSPRSTCKRSAPSMRSQREIAQLRCSDQRTWGNMLGANCKAGSRGVERSDNQRYLLMIFICVRASCMLRSNSSKVMPSSCLPAAMIRSNVLTCCVEFGLGFFLCQKI